MAEISEAAANSINTWSTMASIVVALITAVSAYTAFWTGGILKRHSDERIGAAALKAQLAQEEITTAQVKIAQANEGAEQARAAAARAQLEIAKTAAQLAITKTKLNAANTITTIPDDKLQQLEVCLRGYALPANSFIFPAAPNDRQAEYIAMQIDKVLSLAGIPRNIGNGFQSYVPIGNEHGQFVITYGSDIPETSAKDLAARFRKAGFAASLIKGPKEANLVLDEVARKFIAIRVVPTIKPPF